MSDEINALRNSVSSLSLVGGISRLEMEIRGIGDSFCLFFFFFLNEKRRKEGRSAVEEREDGRCTGAFSAGRTDIVGNEEDLVRR